jgi:O-antigen/teichoic acid export membrane protein
VLGSIGASLVEAAIDRTGYALRAGRGFSVGRILGFGLPLFITTLATLVLARLDLFLLKLLGASTANAGAYAAAQNAALTLGIVAAALAPVVLANLSRARTEGDGAAAELTVRNGLRAGLLLLPWVALLSASATEVAPLLFGPGFSAAAAVLALLVFEGWAMVVHALSGVMLAAAGRSRSLLLLSLPLPLLAGGGLGLAIPRWGMIGAAAVTVTVSVIGALAVAWAASRAWHARPPLASAARGLAVAGVIAVIAIGWSTPGPAVLLKLVLLSVAAPFLLVLTGAVRPGELRAAIASQLANAGR